MRIVFVIFLLQAFVCQAQDDGVKVIELFTSQSCSSCPAADDVLSAVSEHPGVIALGYHVTYWDHLSWVDTFSLKEATQRQAMYKVQRDFAGVFTPEMIVNGAVSFTGSDRVRLRSELLNARVLPRLKLTRVGDKLRIDSSGMLGGTPIEDSLLVLVAVADSQRVVIKSGENSGRAVTYKNIVRGIESAGSFVDGKLLATKLFSAPNVKGIVALLHKDGSGGIVAAGRYEF